MPRLAAAGYHVFAPDVRGYGRSVGWDVKYDDTSAVWQPQQDARHAGAGVGDGLSLGAAVIGHDQGSPLAGWCALRAARRLPVGRDDERAVRRRAGAAVQHRERAAQPAAPAARRRDLRRAREAHAAAQALPALLPDARGEREHVASAAGAPRVPARLLPHEKRRLETEPPASARGANREPSGRSCRATTSWTSNKGMAEQVAAEMPSRRRDRRQPLAARRGAARLQPRSTAAPDSRAGSTAIAAAPATSTCSSSRAGRSTCRPRSWAARATGASIRTPARSSGSRRTLTTKYQGTHLVDGAGHWVQQEQPAEFSRLLIDFIRSV